MSRQSLIVLKFGGSVLRDEDSLSLAVHEIQRWRRNHYRVVAVVSALAGTTETLLQTCRRISPDSAGHAVAAVVAGGELHCASLLGLALDRAGIPGRILWPGAIGMVSNGRPLNAEPQWLTARPIQTALDEDEVVVVPGFVSHDELGRTVVLGRGGSDLTALFLASRLQASRCRLVKDVDGLYEQDPATSEDTPDRYISASWEDALDTDGAIVQHKAIQFARAEGIPFELASVNGTHSTLVGAGATELKPPFQPRPPLRVALLGLGTVGGGIYELMQRMPNLFDVTGVLVRNPSRPRDVDVKPDVLTTHAHEALEDADIVVETIGGVSLPQEWIERSLNSGASVVTANKAVVAASGPALAGLARKLGLRFLHSAAVGGCTPMLERLARSRESVRSVRGVLNGTVNFVLDGLALGKGLDELLQDAHKRGFAESDATRDLSGQDAVDKLVVVADTLHWDLDPAAIRCEPVNERTQARARRAASIGRVLRQVSTLWIESGCVHARVTLEALKRSDPLAATFGEHNAALVERSNGSLEIVRGKGAGRWPTAESLMGDLLEIARDPCPLQARPSNLEPSRNGRVIHAS